MTKVPKHTKKLKNDRKNNETRIKHSEDYSNETYKHVKEGGLAGGGAGKGDADRTGDKKVFRENYDKIFRRKDK